MNLRDYDAEQALLGAVIVQPALMLDLVRQLEPADFADPHCRVIFRGACALAGKDFDPIELRAVIDRDGGLSDSLRDKLALIEARIVSAANWQSHAGIVADLAQRRRLVDAAKQIERLAAEPSEPGKLFGQAEETLLAAGRRERSRDPKTMQQALAEYMRTQIDTDEPDRVIRTGLPTFDRRYRGLRPGQVIVIAARPGMGKSTLALQLAIVAARAGHRVLAFSLEMLAEELAPRALTYDLRTPEDEALDRLRQSERFRADYVASVDRLAGLPIDIDDGVSSTLSDIRAQTRRHQIRHNDLGLVVLDYLQLVTTGRRKYDSRETEIAEVTRGLKLLALSTRLPIVVLAQLNRDSEREKRAPRLSDLRGSGAIEQDADLVLFIHGTQPDKDPEGPGGVVPVDLLIEKARKGPIGHVEGLFFTAWSRFEEATPNDPTTERHP